MTETQFDEKIREMLSEPQEQLPEGLWEGIASRLDEAEGKRRRAAVPVRRWLAAVSSVAAAVVAGLVIAHFIPSEQSAGDEVLAEAAAVETPAEADTSRETESGQGKDDSAKAGEVRFDVVKKSSSLIAMAVVPEPVRETAEKEAAGAEADEAAGRVEGEGMIEAAGTTEAVEETGTVETAHTADGTDSDADAGETGYDLKVDNSDIEAAYGREENDEEAYRRTPFEISVGGNSFGGPQKSSTQKRMFTKGNKTPTGKTFVEGSNSDSYSLPLSFGVGVKYGITKWLGIGVGVNYTLLNKKVTGTYRDEHDWSCSTDMKNSQHYIGIPVDIYFSMFRTKRWDAYATVGGAVEKCILNKYTGTFEGESLLYTNKVSGVQTSVKLGLGVEFSPIDFLGIYLDPSLRYYFDNKQPRSIRTAQPLAFGVEAGLRFKL